MSDQTTTVRDRLGPYITEAKLQGYIDAGLLLLDGDVVTSLDDPAPEDGSGRFVIAGS